MLLNSTYNSTVWTLLWTGHKQSMSFKRPRFIKKNVPEHFKLQCDKQFHNKKFP